MIHPKPSGLLAKSRCDKGAKQAYSESEEEVFEEETEEEEEPETVHRPLGGTGDRKPPEPKGPPPAKRPPVPDQSGQKHRHRHSEGDRRQHHSDRGSHQQKRKHRAGRKHQRIGRLEQDPEAPVHQKLSGHFLDNLTSELERSSTHRLQ